MCFIIHYPNAMVLVRTVRASLVNRLHTNDGFSPYGIAQPCSDIHFSHIQENIYNNFDRNSFFLFEILEKYGIDDPSKTERGKVFVSTIYMKCLLPCVEN